MTPAMDYTTFVNLVFQMRKYQREFFRLKPADRPPSLIVQAKKAEQAVDRALAELQQGQGYLTWENPP